MNVGPGFFDSVAHSQGTTSEKNKKKRGVVRKSKAKLSPQFLYSHVLPVVLAFDVLKSRNSLAVGSSPARPAPNFQRFARRPRAQLAGHRGGNVESGSRGHRYPRAGRRGHRARVGGLLNGQSGGSASCVLGCVGRGNLDLVRPDGNFPLIGNPCPR